MFPGAANAWATTVSSYSSAAAATSSMSWWAPFTAQVRAHDGELLARVASGVGERGIHRREDPHFVLGSSCDADDGHGRRTSAVTK